MPSPGRTSGSATTALMSWAYKGSLGRQIWLQFSLFFIWFEKLKFRLYIHSVPHYILNDFTANKYIHGRNYVEVLHWRCDHRVPIDSVSPSAHGFEYSALSCRYSPSKYRVGAVNSPSTPPIYILKSRRHKTVKYSSSNNLFINFRLNFGYKYQFFLCVIFLIFISSKAVFSHLAFSQCFLYMCRQQRALSCARIFFSWDG